MTYKVIIELEGFTEQPTSEMVAHRLLRAFTNNMDSFELEYTWIDSGKILEAKEKFKVEDDG